jgi:hypothetical protein
LEDEDYEEDEVKTPHSRVSVHSDLRPAGRRRHSGTEDPSSLPLSFLPGEVCERALELNIILDMQAPSDCVPLAMQPPEPVPDLSWCRS